MDNNIGRLIREKRKEKKLTLEDVSKKLGVGASAISKWERGYIKNMKRDKVKPLADILGIDPLILVYGIDDTKEKEEITPLEFKTEVIQRLELVTNLSEQEKQMLITNIEFICSDK